MMRKSFSKAKFALSDSASQSSKSRSKLQQQPIERAPTLPVIEPPTVLDVLRYRYHHGANLGGFFVLEKWLQPGMFDPVADRDSELDAVRA